MGSLALNPSCSRCRDRQDRIEELEEEVRQLRAAAFGEEMMFPARWRLTPMETTLLRCLMAREIVNWPVFEAAVQATRWDYDAEPKILDVYVCKLRKKVRPFGVEIYTRRGAGWSLGRETKAAIAAALASGSPHAGPAIERASHHPGAVTAELIALVGKHPKGLHVRDIAARFPENPGVGTLLRQIVESGRLERRLAGRSLREGFVYFPMGRATG